VTHAPSKDLVSDNLGQLLELMRRLRDPQSGCPWDREQDFATIAPYTIEEAYEVAEAIASGRPEELRDELGDLLFQVVFHAQLATERGWFNFADVTSAVVSKMLRRHPHVFGPQEVGPAKVLDAAAQTLAWETMKRNERGTQLDDSALAGVSLGMPEMARALKLTRRAASVGFDWPDPKPVLDKLHEEIEEFKEALQTSDSAAREDEFGDMLFVLVNLARHYQIDPQAALRAANRKFERRFRGMEQLAKARGTGLAGMSLHEQDALWDEMKRQERSEKPAHD